MKAGSSHSTRSEANRFERHAAGGARPSFNRLGQLAGSPSPSQTSQLRKSVDVTVNPASGLSAAIRRSRRPWRSGSTGQAGAIPGRELSLSKKDLRPFSAVCNSQARPLPSPAPHARGAREAAGLIGGRLEELALGVKEGVEERSPAPARRRLRSPEHPLPLWRPAFPNTQRLCGLGADRCQTSPQSAFHFVPFPSISFRELSLINALHGRPGQEKNSLPLFPARAVSDLPQVGRGDPKAPWSIDLISCECKCERRAGRTPNTRPRLGSYGHFARAGRTAKGRARSSSLPRRLAGRAGGEKVVGGVQKRHEAGHAVRSFRQSPTVSQLPSFVHCLFSLEPMAGSSPAGGAPGS